MSYRNLTVSLGTNKRHTRLSALLDEHIQRERKAKGKISVSEILIGLLENALGQPAGLADPVLIIMDKLDKIENKITNARFAPTDISQEDITDEMKQIVHNITGGDFD